MTLSLSTMWAHPPPSTLCFRFGNPNRKHRSYGRFIAFSSRIAIAVDKQHILSEIKRTATLNGGRPLGTARFEKQTGIRVYDWAGKYWVGWGEALSEAGFAPNKLQEAYPDDAILAQLADIVRKLGHLPTSRELRLLRHNDSTVPRHGVFSRVAPTKRDMVAALVSYCELNPGLDDVAAICEAAAVPDEPATTDNGKTAVLGEVYLIKSGRHYKIGFSVSAERRTREFQIQLPDPPKRIHSIRTDDPRGVEAYWHRRFDAKRVRPDAEFFKLDASDVTAFCAWKRIAP